MKNRDIEKYNLSEEHKAELRRLRNTRRQLRKGNKHLNKAQQDRMHELQANGRK